MSDAGDKSLDSRGFRTRWVRTLSAFVLGGVLLAGYVWLVGPAAIHRALVSVSPRRLSSLIVVGVVPFVIWGLGLHLIFRRLGLARRLLTAVLLFSAANFLNSVTPFGQAGGDPVSAILFKRSLRTDFETGLAAIGSLNALNRIASVFLGLLGIGYLGTQVAFSQTLEIAAVVVVAVTVIVLGGAAVIWQYRELILHWSSGALAKVLKPTRHLPGITPPSRDSLLQRGYRFIEAIGSLVDSPGILAWVFLAGIAGKLAVASTLWVALAALGVSAPFAVVLLLIPVAELSGTAPTPGGFGSAEAVLTALMMATIGVDAAIAGAAALLYRASAFWLPAMFGGMVTAWYAISEPHSRKGAADASGISHTSLAEETPLMEWDTDLTVTILLLAVSGALVTLVAVVVHGQQLLIEPESLLVHATRDSALVVVSFGLTWFVLREITVRWYK